MSWITVVWSMSISACLTMALIHVAVWARDRGARAHLAYSIMSVAATGIAIGELAMMRAETVPQVAAAIRTAADRRRRDSGDRHRRPSEHATF